MERVGFTMRLRPGQEAEYRRRHAAVWPEMLDALKAAGARDYRWQAEMAELIDPLTDPATGFHQRLEEIFHLD